MSLGMAQALRVAGSSVEVDTDTEAPSVSTKVYRQIYGEDAPYPPGPECLRVWCPIANVPENEKRVHAWWDSAISALENYVNV